MSRGSPKISRVSTELEQEHSPMPKWLNDFAKSEAKKNDEPKTAVEVARERNERSLLDQLNSIMQRKSRHLSVESVVEEMRERTGLNSYLQSISAQEEEQVKKAQTAGQTAQPMTTQHAVPAPSSPQAPKFPSSLAKYKNGSENIDAFIKRIVSKFSGAGITIPQVQYDLMQMFGTKYNLQPNDVWNQEVAAYINHLISEAQAANIKPDFNPALGTGLETETQDANGGDAFAILNPAKS